MRVAKEPGAHGSGPGTCVWGEPSAGVAGAVLGAAPGEGPRPGKDQAGTGPGPGAEFGSCQTEAFALIGIIMASNRVLLRHPGKELHGEADTGVVSVATMAKRTKA